MLIGDIVMAPLDADYIDADGSVMLLCDGRVVAPAAYPALVALIGATFGALGRIPDFGVAAGVTGRNPIGAALAGGYALGATGGVETHGHTVLPVVVTHHFAGDTADAVGPCADYLAGITQFAAARHHHTVIGDPGDHTLNQPTDTNWVSSVLGTGFFIKAA